MTKHVFNKSNWSGETMSILVKEDGSFKFHGNTITLIKNTKASGGDFTLMDVLENGQKVASVSKFDGDKAWTAQSDFATDYSRTDDVPQVAAAKLLCNI